MNILKKIYLFLLLTFSFSVYAVELTDFENQMIQETLEFRFSLILCQTPDEAISKIDEFYTELTSEQVKNQLSEEIQIVVESMIMHEKYNYIYEKEIKSPLLEPIITGEYHKIKDYVSRHKKETYSIWFYAASGDILSASLQFLSIGDAMKEGLTVRKYYDAALEQKPDFSYCLMNMAQWYYYAPAVSGGSKEKALSFFNQAVQGATCNYEAYFSNLWLSQFYFEKKQTADCEKYFDASEKLLGKNRYNDFIKYLNDNDFSLLYYTPNREKVEKKIAKKS